MRRAVDAGEVGSPTTGGNQRFCRTVTSVGGFQDVAERSEYDGKRSRVPSDLQNQPQHPGAPQDKMSELHHECGVAAIYHLPGKEASPLCPEQGPDEVSRLMPRMLLDIQNRGQLSAGMTSFNPLRNQLIDTYKDVGSVSEVFRLNHRGKCESLMRKYAGRAAIGHVRYATCGAEDRSYAQPFERHHVQKHKWFSFAFNGQLANYAELRNESAGQRRQPSGPRYRHRNHHARHRP